MFDYSTNWVETFHEIRQWAYVFPLYRDFIHKKKHLYVLAWSSAGSALILLQNIHLLSFITGIDRTWAELRSD